MGDKRAVAAMDPDVAIELRRHMREAVRLSGRYFGGTRFEEDDLQPRLEEFTDLAECVLNAVLAEGFRVSAGDETVPVPIGVQSAARELSSICSLVAFLERVPRSLVERAARAGEMDMAGAGAPPAWQLVLERAFFSAPLFCFPTDPLKAAEAVLKLVRWQAPSFPERFRNPSPEAMRKAASVIKTLQGDRKVTALGIARSENGKRAKVARGRVTAWSAARGFAQALGVRIPREADAKRDWGAYARPDRPAKRGSRDR